VSHSIAEISKAACMANRGEYSPAAISTLNIGKSAGFYRVPLIYATCSLACNSTAAEASKYFVQRIHSIFDLNIL